MADYEVTHTYKNGIPLVFWYTLKFGDEDHSFDIRSFAKHFPANVDEDYWMATKDKDRLAISTWMLNFYPKEDVLRWIIEDAVPV